MRSWHIVEISLRYPWDIVGMSWGYLKDIPTISQGYLNPAICMELAYCFDVIWRTIRLFQVVFWQILRDKAKVTTVGIPFVQEVCPLILKLGSAPIAVISGSELSTRR